MDEEVAKAATSRTTISHGVGEHEEKTKTGNFGLVSSVNCKVKEKDNVSESSSISGCVLRMETGSSSSSASSFPSPSSSIYSDDSEPEIPDSETATDAMEDMEQMDRYFARALQLRELRDMWMNELVLMNDAGADWTDLRDQALQVDMLDLSDEDDFDEPPPQEIPTYPIGPKSYVECAVCFEVSSLLLRPCCDLPVCGDCLSQYLMSEVNQGNVRIECLSPSCSSYIHRDEVLAKLDTATKEKYYKFLVDTNQEPHIKSCPRCSYIMTLTKETVKLFKSFPKGYRVECTSCSLVWCFPCQAPWHEGIQCSDYRKGDKMLKSWAKRQRGGQQNAQKCPRCRVYIQRAAGCDHMICSRCKTNFCYRCGERFRQIKFIGDHYSRLSVFGCRYRFMPEKPVQRKLIRGAILGGKLLVAPVVAATGAALALGLGTIAAPFYGGYRLHKHLKQRRRRLRAPVLQVRFPYSESQDYFDSLGFNRDTLLDRNGLQDLSQFLPFATMPRPSQRETPVDSTDISPTQEEPDQLASIPEVLFNEVSGETSQTQVTAHTENKSPSIMTKTTIARLEMEDSNSVTGATDSPRRKRAVHSVSRTVKFQAENSDSDKTTESTALAYPMEVINVVTVESSSNASDFERESEGNSNGSVVVPRKTKRPLRLRKSSPGSQKPAQPDDQSDSNNHGTAEESCLPPGEKIHAKTETKSIAGKDVEKKYAEDLSVRSSIKDENKNNSHTPWLNIVCGKLVKEKDESSKKQSVADNCSVKGCKKVETNCERSCDQDVTCFHQHVSIVKFNFDSQSEECEDSIVSTNQQPAYNQIDRLGPFGPTSDGEDDWSVSSTNPSPSCEFRPAYYNPVEPNLDFIDEDVIAQTTETTCL